MNTCRVVFGNCCLTQLTEVSSGGDYAGYLHQQGVVNVPLEDLGGYRNLLGVFGIPVGDRRRRRMV